LLTNAVKYNVTGGSIWVEARVAPSEHVLQVGDSGVGIPQEAIPHLFDKFYRVKGAERLASGTGLGLSICKQIIEKHGGRITVESQPGKGTVFTIHLPFGKAT
jgi:signal transduction histidine kinase